MGSGRSFSRRSPRLRFLVVSIISLIFFFYTLRPHSFDSDSTFSTGYFPGMQKDSGSQWRFSLGSKKEQYRRIQYPFRANGREAGDATKAAAVKKTMQDTFWKYRKTAWGQDEVQPITGNGSTTRNGWAATIVDTLTTTAMMGLEEEFMLELKYTIGEIQWSQAVDLVDPFETTIRYLGALVSTIDLIDTSVLARSLVSPAQRTALLAQAVALAEKLGPSFDSPTGLPWPRVNFTSDEGCREDFAEIPSYDHPTVGPARAGSNWLENKSLSRLTGDRIYEVNATKSWKPLVWNKYVEEWTGLIDGPFDIITGEPVDMHRSWGAGHDSYYEYLIKAHIMAPKDRFANRYRDRWVQAVESTIRHLAYRSVHPDTKEPGKIFLAHWRNGWTINEMGHLACFAGGNMALGGKFLARDDILKFGLDLVDTCHTTYVGTTTGIGPEYFSWFPENKESVFEPQHDGHWEQARKSGNFWVTDARWMLRPETVESYFYAYRITGDKQYQDWAWDAYEAFIKASSAEFGFAEVQDVTQPGGPDNQNDKAESFWGAETLKYLYLTFTDEDIGSLDEWVYSTEAHPFRIMR